MNTDIDQRHTPRILFNRPALLAFDRELIDATTEDISMNGILIQSSKLIETTNHIQIILKYSIDRHILMNIKKIWSTLILDDNFNCWRMGNIITGISPKDQNLLASIVLDNLAEVSYPEITL